MIGPFCIGPQFLAGLFCIVPGIGAKFVLNFKQNMVHTKKFLFKKTTSMLTSLKVSSLPHKCVFYRRYHKANGEPNGNEFWRSWNAKLNIPTHMVDEKNGIICIIIWFIPGVLVIKMWKMVHFLYFLLMAGKHSAQFEQNIYVQLKNLKLFQKMLRIIGFLSYH